MNILPVIDVSGLAGPEAERQAVASQIAAACRAHGFFYVTGHGIDPALVRQLEALSRKFFALDETTKMRWRMSLAGRAWRGYFPLGGELTSGGRTGKKASTWAPSCPTTIPWWWAKRRCTAATCFPGSTASGRPSSTTWPR
jgi:isopenicillin N synthase-like dioxygenase